MSNIKESPYVCTETYTVKFWRINADELKKLTEVKTNYLCISKEK